MPIQSDTVDHGVATREGWDILDCGPNPDGRSRMQLQCEDCPEDREPPLATDRDAWEHVVARPSDGIPRAYARETLAISARAGSVPHRDALATVDDAERMLIEAACGAW